MLLCRLTLRSTKKVFHGAVRAISVNSSAWMPDSREEMEKVVIRAHMADLEDFHNASAEDVVPWFFKMMPPLYFDLLSRDTRMYHLRALTALKGSGSSLELTLNRKKEITFIRPGLVCCFILHTNTFTS
jgi:hypothetical protein